MKTLFVFLALLYAGSHLVFRQTHIEVWQRDNQAYVILQTSALALYYLWRPLTYIDGALTGMRHHIGPHR